MTEEPGLPTAEEELRRDYLFINDPLDSWARALAMTALAVIIPAAADDFEDFDARIPLACLTILGLFSAWARRNARRFDGSAFRRSLAKTETRFRWILPGCWLLLTVVPLGYLLLLWRRWGYWEEASREDGLGVEAYGGWGSLLFRGRDISLFVLGGAQASLLGWISLRIRPRLRAALART